MDSRIRGNDGDGFVTKALASYLREAARNNLPIDRSLSLSLVLSLSKGRAREVGKLFLAASLTGK